MTQERKSNMGESVFPVSDKELLSSILSQAEPQVDYTVEFMSTNNESVIHVEVVKATSKMHACAVAMDVVPVALANGKGEMRATRVGMTLDDIKVAVVAGKRVCHQSEAYEVQRDKLGRFNIVCAFNGYTIGLTWMDGVTMNGKPDEFFIVEGK